MADCGRNSVLKMLLEQEDVTENRVRARQLLQREFEWST